MTYNINVTRDNEPHAEYDTEEFVLIYATAQSWGLAVRNMSSFELMQIAGKLIEYALGPHYKAAKGEEVTILS